MFRACIDDARRRPPGRAGGGDQAPHRMEQKRAGPARRIEHPLLQRLLHGRRDDPRGEPVRRVIFPQVVALVRIDQAFIQDFQHVGFDVRQAEAGGLQRDVTHQIRPGRQPQGPVEEIGFHRAQYALVRQRAARQQRRGVGYRQVQHARGDRLYDNGQVGVLQEQRIVADVLAIGFTQQPVPQLPLQPHLGMVAQFGPQRLQRHAAAAEDHAVATKGLRHHAWLRHEIRRVGEQQFQPGQQLVPTLRVSGIPRQFPQRAVAQHIGDERGAVGCQPGHRTRTSGPPSGIGEVIRHAREHVVQFAPQVALQLDDRGAPHRVDAATAVQQIDLVTDFLIRRVEARPQ